MWWVVILHLTPFSFCLKDELSFRGGTALHKLFFSPTARYSEDIDLVRTNKGPISAIADAIRKRLEPWLGKAKTEPTSRSFKIKFFFNPENSPSTKLRIKIEINIDLKLKEQSFVDDIGPLLSPELNKSFSKSLMTEDGNRIATEGWSLQDATEEVKNKILIHFPK